VSRRPSLFIRDIDDSGAKDAARGCRFGAVDAGERLCLTTPVAPDRNPSALRIEEQNRARRRNRRRDVPLSCRPPGSGLKAAPKAGPALLADTNHVLKTVTSDDRRANGATYADPSLPLTPGVIDAIANFVTAASKGP
jgi:hypothetical protein